MNVQNESGIETLKKARRLRSFANRAGFSYERARYVNGYWESDIQTSYAVKRVVSKTKEALFYEALDIIKEVETNVIETSIQQILDDALAFRKCTFSKKTETGYRILRGEVLRVSACTDKSEFDVFVLVANENRVAKISMTPKDVIRIEPK